MPIKSMSTMSGTLFIVATPIGHVADISARAIQTLSVVEVIYAEDTRRTSRLLKEHGIANRLVSMHEHNEENRLEQILETLISGASVALVSDAGTPLISDPGYRLVRLCHDRHIPVSPIPGPSALVAALSVGGLPTDSFVFLGFPPAKSGARKQWFQEAAMETRTVVVYESRHRIVESVRDLGETFGPEREATLARELTKTYETVRQATLKELLDFLEAKEERQRGEFVILLAGKKEQPSADDAELRRVLNILLKDLSVKQSSSLAAEITGRKKKEVYALALGIKDGSSDSC